MADKFIRTLRSLIMQIKLLNADSGLPAFCSETGRSSLKGVVLAY